MHREGKIKGIMRIVLDEGHNIQYSSLDNQSTAEYIEKFDILNKLPDDLSIKYDLEDCCVTVDKVIIAGDTYYFVTAVSGHPKCENCSKVLIDTITGLYNRNYWEQITSGATFRTGTQNFSLILIDIDNLKEINDTYGHMAGDKAIETVGQAIKKSIRKEDAGLRYGGDEFIILLFNQDEEAADKVIERIRREIKKLTAKQEMDIQISTGVAHYDCLKNVGNIIKIADKNLYKEKRLKKSKERLGREKLRRLLGEIKNLRDELNVKAIQDGKGMDNEETLNLRQKLDEMIMRYLLDEA